MHILCILFQLSSGGFWPFVHPHSVLWDAFVVSMVSLPMLISFTVLCGVGYGCAYTPPIQALLEWFPDKKGLASGIVIAGFGSGALFFAPVMNAFMSAATTLPTYLGRSVETVTEGGKMFARVGGQLQEVFCHLRHLNERG